MRTRLLAATLWAAAFAGMAFAQDGTISGTVSDSTGAVLANASVKLTNRGQNSVRAVETNQAGVFQYSFLAAGAYDLEVSAQGFKTQTRTGITLAVAQNLRLDVTMELGNVTENVTVSGAVETINTASSELGAVVDNTKVVEMPLNGRVWWSLSTLVPGVVPPAQGSANGFRGGFNVSGTAEQANNFTFNGMDNNDNTTSSPAFRPSIDVIQEFNILTGVYPAQYGYGAGGQVIVTTKSGTNQYHGSLYEFIRNSAVLTARNFFQPAGPLPSFKRNQFGGTFGGPIRRDKTFFFFGYEGLRLRESFNAVDIVPTAGMHNGDFSAYRTATLRDPSGGVFAGNIIPVNRISAVGQALMAFYPDPTNTAAAPGSQNYAFSAIRPETQNVSSLKLDHQFSVKDSAFLTVNYFNDTATERTNQLGCASTPLPAFGCDTYVKHILAGIAETHIFSASMVNDFRFGETYEFNPSIVVSAGTKFWPRFGIEPLTTPIDPGLPRYGPPTTAVTGYTGFANSVFRRNDPRWMINDTFSLTSGRHTIKIGGAESHLGTNVTPPTTVAGSVSFTNTSAGPTTGYGMADLLLGLPASTTLKPNPIKYYPRVSYIGAFIQDDFKVSARLTLNLGLRWELTTPPKELQHLQTSFDPVKGVPIVENKNGYGEHMFRFDWHDYAPRLGFAWQPWGDSKTVVRGGTGVFYTSFPIYNTNTSFLYAGYPVTITQSFTSSLNQPLLLSNPFPAANAVISNTTNGSQFNYRNARLYEWSLGLQRQLTNDMVAEVTFMGSIGNHLRVTQNINQPPPGAGTPAQVNARRPYPTYGTINMIDSVGNSSYNSLQAKLNKRLGYGLSFLVAWTYSHSIDNVNAQTSAFDLRTARGSSAFDVRNRIVVSPVYELPFGKGKTWATGGLAAAIAGGWQLSPLVQWQTGNPLTATMSGNYSNSGGGTDRPDLVGDPNENAPHSPQQWFNTAAFVRTRAANGAAGATYSFGNAGVGVIKSPGLINMDVTIARTFRFTERLDAQFRAEFYNLANHPNLGYPNLVADTAAFGTISTALTPRVSQFALKLRF